MPMKVKVEVFLEACHSLVPTMGLGGVQGLSQGAMHAYQGTKELVTHL